MRFALALQGFKGADHVLATRQPRPAMSPRETRAAARTT